MGQAAGDGLGVAVAVGAGEAAAGRAAHDEARIDGVGQDDGVGIGDAGVVDAQAEGVTGGPGIDGVIGERLD